MTQLQNTYLGTERSAVYTGAVTSSFIPIVAGVTYPDPNYVIYRSNADIYVFEYVLEGKGFVRQDEERAEVRASDAYLLQPGRLHHYYPDPENPWKKIWFNCKGSLVRHLLADYGLNQTLVFPGFGQEEYLQEILNLITNEPAQCCQMLALSLHRHIQALANLRKQEMREHTQALIMKNYIEQNLTHALPIEEVAESAHLSPSRALHLFKEAFGIPPYRYYLTQRMELAQSMLLDTNLSIQEIADRLGFEDYHHFSTFFKKECGLSPSRFRKAQSEE